jgi:hypothetical protein
MILKLIIGVPVEVELLRRCAISGTSRGITGKLHNEGGTRTEQGSRRVRPGLGSDSLPASNDVLHFCLMVSPACLCERRSFHTGPECWTPFVAECVKLRGVCGKRAKLKNVRPLCKVQLLLESLCSEPRDSRLETMSSSAQLLT